MNKSKGKILFGKILAIPSTHTVIVGVDVFKRHPLYKKAVRRTRRFAVHCEIDTLTIGDKVSIRETKPVSRTKHFVVQEKVV